MLEWLHSTSAGPLDAARVGGKAAGLSRLGALAPPGLALDRTVFDGLLGDRRAQVEAHMAAVDLNDPCSALVAAEAIAALVADVVLPLERAEEIITSVAALGPGPYIVRSSAIGEDGRAASFAGQLHSYLDVPAAELAAAAVRVWASRFAAGVLAYEQSGRGRLSGVAVLVQPMLTARFGGVLFTRCPQDRELMRIEAVAGHPEPLVQGMVDPLVYRVRRGDLQLVEEAEDGPPVAQLMDLAKTAQQLEIERGVPLDVEWIIDEGGALRLVQVRPIAAAPSPPRPAATAAKPLAGGPVQVFSNANMNENYPAPISPLLYSIARESYAAYFAALGRAFGVDAGRIAAAAPALRRIVAVHRGRLYYTLSAIHQAIGQAPFGARLVRYFDAFVGARGASVAPGPPTRLTEIAAMAARTLGTLRSLDDDLIGFEGAIEAYAAAAPGWSTAPMHVRVAAGLGGFRTIRLERWAPAAVADAVTSIGHGLLGDLLQGVVEPVEILPLFEGLGDLASLGPVDDLWDLSRRVRAGQPSAAAKAAYVARWGFRCGCELMLLEPRLAERPALLDALLDRYVELDGPSPTTRRAVALRRRKAQTIAVRRRLPIVRRPLFDALLDLTHGAIRRRERARLAQARLYGALRQAVLAIGDGLVEHGWLPDREAAFWLEFGELERLASGLEMFPDLAADTVAARRQARETQADVAPPARIELPWGTYFAGHEVEADAPHGQALTGVACAAGQVTGAARCLSELGEASRLGRGDILVTARTDPGWAPLFFVAGGLVLERGGLLSHGAIVAREFGIPAVLNVRDAMTRITDGATVTVDGTAGTVEVVE
ncbi:MAG: phosphohistidine swiveling domain-containing protein [Bradymonadia bacterium]|jgi:phosphohistidine swiveling domain-containing protein